MICPSAGRSTACAEKSVKKHFPDISGLRFLPMVGILAAIFSSASVPGRTLFFLNLHHFDKILHATAYAALAASCIFAFRLQVNNARSRLRTSGQVAAMCLLCGVMEEFYQHFIPNRVMDRKDVFADMIGAMAVVAAWNIRAYLQRKE